MDTLKRSNDEKSGLFRDIWIQKSVVASKKVTYSATYAYKKTR